MRTRNAQIGKGTGREMNISLPYCSRCQCPLIMFNSCKHGAHFPKTILLIRYYVRNCSHTHKEDVKLPIRSKMYGRRFQLCTGGSKLNVQPTSLLHTSRVRGKKDL